MNQPPSEVSNPAVNLSENERFVALLDQMQRRDAWTRMMLLLAFGILLLLGSFLWVFGHRQSTRVDRHANDADAWRESLIAMSRQPDGWNGGISASILRSFLGSGTHHDDAVAASGLFLRKLSDPAAFQQLLYAVYPSPGYTDLKDVLGIGRDLTSRRTVIYTRKQQVIDSSKDKKPAAYDYAGQISDLDNQVNTLGDELTSVCNKVGEILRKPRPSNDLALNLSGLYFYSCDLSGTNLSYSNLSSTTFEDTDVAGATLKNVTGYDGFDFYNSAWWRAKEIGPDFLVYLKDHTYPYYKGDIYPWTRKPKPEEYFSNLDRLCKIASVDCSNKPAKFPKQ